MKKFLLLALSLLTVLSLSFAVACDGDDSSLVELPNSLVTEESTTSGSNSSQGGEVETTLSGVEYVSGIKNLELGAPIELDELVLKLSYSDGSSENVAYADLDQTALSATCDTTKLGATTATISYKGFSTEASLRVYCWADSVTVPSSISNFAANKGDASNFKDKTQSYKVGDDSVFYFSPIVAAWNYDGDLLYFDSVGEVEISAKLYILEGSEYVLVENTADYVEIDAVNASFDFTETAIGKNFKIVVVPQACVDAGEGEEADFVKSLEIAVVDGYNVYTAADLLLWDNHNADVAAFRAEKGITVDASTVSTLVLHNNISLTGSDIPSCHIYDKVRDADHFASLSDEKKARLQGSLKDYAYILDRHLGDNGQFTFEGNYFTIDASAVPYIMKEDGDNSLEILPTSIVSHSSLFRIRGNAHSNDTTATEDFHMNNVNLIGNLNRQETVESSGGLILAKFELTRGTTYNMVSKSWYINNFVSENATGHEFVIDSCIFEDSYNSLLYVWGGLVEIKNSRIYGAGGPAIIADHVTPDDDTSGRIGSGGWTSEIVVDDNSQIASYVTGQEAWFAEFNAQSAVGLMMTLSELFFKAKFEKTFVTNVTVDGETQKVINLMLVIKSGESEGMSSDKISGTAKIGDHVLDFDEENTAKMIDAHGSSGRNMFQSKTPSSIIALVDMNNSILANPNGVIMDPNVLMTNPMCLPTAYGGDVGYLNIFVGGDREGFMGVILGDFGMAG